MGRGARRHMFRAPTSVVVTSFIIFLFRVLDWDEVFFYVSQLYIVPAPQVLLCVFELQTMLNHGIYVCMLYTP